MPGVWYHLPQVYFTYFHANLFYVGRLRFFAKVHKILRIFAKIWEKSVRVFFRENLTVTATFLFQYSSK